MEKIINNIIEEFNFLQSEYGFTKVNKEFDEQYANVIFYSKNIIIKIEKYRRELYMYIASTDDPDLWLNVFNIIDFQNQGLSSKSSPNYYEDVTDLFECLLMQIEWLGVVLKQNYLQIYQFYNSKDYKNNIEELKNYMIKKNPNLFKQL